jgi:hypothetical protein
MDSRAADHDFAPSLMDGYIVERRRQAVGQYVCCASDRSQLVHSPQQ